MTKISSCANIADERHNVGIFLLSPPKKRLQERNNVHSIASYNLDEGVARFMLYLSHTDSLTLSMLSQLASQLYLYTAPL